jgi:hypothetical protein
MSNVENGSNLGTDREEHRHPIHFKVDGEPYTTEAKELTPNEIIREFAGLDVTSHYLVEIQGHKKESFEGRGDVPIMLTEGEKFQVIRIGPTPVSDSSDEHRS